MTRAENAQRVAELAAQGLNGLQIAERLGLSRAYTYELLTDPDGQKVRARKRRYDKACTDCGGRVDGTTPSKSAGRCKPCHNAFWRTNGERVDMRRVHERAERIVAWWAQGRTLREIGDELGWTSLEVTTEMARLRAKGYDLPYRYQRRQVAA